MDKTDKEYQDRCMKEYADECNNQLLKDAEVFSQVALIVSDTALADIKHSMKMSDNFYDFSIISESIGEYQEEDEFEELSGQWVDQTTNGGCTGDEFAGTICI